MEKIPAVAPPSSGHIGESVWRAAVEGGDPVPERSRSLVRNYPMFNYPAAASAPSAPHALPAEDVPAIKVDKAAIEAAKATSAQIDASAAKSLAQHKDVGATGSSGYAAHEVLDDTLHQDRKQKIQSVAGPDVTDQIGRSVHNSAMEGGDANPGDNRG